MPHFWTVKSLARRWGLSPGSVYKRLKSGRLRGSKLGGGVWRIADEEVERFERDDLAQILEAPDEDDEEQGA